MAISPTGLRLSRARADVAVAATTRGTDHGPLTGLLLAAAGRPAEHGASMPLRLAVGALLFGSYTHWSHGFPWDIAHASESSRPEPVEAAVVWVVLALTPRAGIRSVLGSPPPNALARPVPQSV